MRFTTVVQTAGWPEWLTDKTPTTELAKAMRENRLAVVHHGERACDADWAEPGSSAVNRTGHIIFPRPLPADCKFISGITPYLGVITLRKGETIKI